MIAIPLAVIIYALFDAINSDKSEVRRMPRWTWIVAIIFLPLVGALLWFFFGRPKKERQAPPNTSTWQQPERPPQGPDDDPDFLKGL